MRLGAACLCLTALLACLTEARQSRRGRGGTVQTIAADQRARADAAAPVHQRGASAARNHHTGRRPASEHQRGASAARIHHTGRRPASEHPPVYYLVSPPAASSPAATHSLSQERRHSPAATHSRSQTGRHSPAATHSLSQKRRHSPDGLQFPFTRKGQFLRRIWIPRPEKTELSARKRTARLDAPSADEVGLRSSDGAAETAAGSAAVESASLRTEQSAAAVGVESESFEVESIPDVSASMIDMKALLEKLMKQADVTDEDNAVDVLDGPTSKRHQTSEAAADAPEDHPRLSANKVTPQPASGGAAQPAFHRGPVRDSQLQGMQLTAAAAQAEAAEGTPALDTEPFVPLVSPAQPAAAPARLPDLLASAAAPDSSPATAPARLPDLLTPDSGTGWSASLAGFLGGREDGENAERLSSEHSAGGRASPGRERLRGGAASPQQVQEARGAASPQQVQEARGAASPQQVQEARGAASPQQVQEARGAASPQQVQEVQPLATGAPRGPGTFFDFVNSPMTPQDGSNCTFDPMNDAPPGPQLTGAVRPQPQPQPQPQSQQQPLPQSQPQPQPLQPLPAPEPVPDRQPLLKPVPRPLPGRLPVPPSAAAAPVPEQVTAPGGQCAPCRCSCPAPAGRPEPLL